MIRPCADEDFDSILTIVNDGAEAYRNAIPADCWHEPYMPREELRREIDDGVTFWGYEENGVLTGVMGIQHVDDVTLIRHAYVRTVAQGQGIGGRLLSHLRPLARGPVLIGTWADAAWAIGFYQKHGFRVVSQDEKERLLRRYWNVPPRQIATSVVLADAAQQDQP